MIQFSLTPYVLKTNSPGLVSHRPLWLSPHQVMVVPVGPTCDEYAQRVSSVYDALISVSSDSSINYQVIIRVLKSPC